MTIQKDNYYIVTGAPGTGKTTLLNELGTFFKTIKEPARDVIDKQQVSNGPSWNNDRAKFVDLLMEQSISDFIQAPHNEVTFFDRGIPDCIAYALYGDVAMSSLLNTATNYRYNKKVFVLSPWKEIYVNDKERTMSYEETLLFHSQIVSVYTKLDYSIVVVPEGHVETRFDFIIKQIWTHRTIL